MERSPQEIREYVGGMKLLVINGMDRASDEWLLKLPGSLLYIHLANGTEVATMTNIPDDTMNEVDGFLVWCGLLPA